MYCSVAYVPLLFFFFRFALFVGFQFSSVCLVEMGAPLPPLVFCSCIDRFILFIIYIISYYNICSCMVWCFFLVFFATEILFFFFFKLASVFQSCTHWLFIIRAVFYHPIVFYNICWTLTFQMFWFLYYLPPSLSLSFCLFGFMAFVSFFAQHIRFIPFMLDRFSHTLYFFFRTSRGT